MSCKIKTPDEIKSLEKNNLFIYGFEGTPTQEDSAAAIEHSSNMFALQSQPGAPVVGMRDDRKRYTMMGHPDWYLKYRATHPSTLAFEKGKSEETIAEIERVSGNKTKGGTFVHSSLEEIGRAIYREYTKESGTSLADIKAKYLSGVDGFKMSSEQFDKLVKGVRDIINDIHKKQDQLNKRYGTPDGKVKIYFEAVIVDPRKDMAGTMDVLAVFSDNTGFLYDYKTMSPSSMFHDGKKITKDFIYKNKKEEWKMQLGTYKRTLLENYGIKAILGTRVVPIWTKFAWDDKAKVFTNEIQDVQMGISDSEFLKQVMATYEKVGIKQIDEFLTQKYKRIETLKKSLKDSPNRDEVINRIKDLEDSIYKFIFEKKIETMVHDTIAMTQKLAEKIEKDPDAISMEDLNNTLAEVSVMLNFIEQFRKDKSIFEVKDKDLTDNFFNTIQEPKIVEELNKIYEVYGRINSFRTERVLDPIVAEEGEIMDQDGNIILREDDFFTRIFGRVSQFSNPFIAEFTKKKDDALQKTRDSVREVESKMIKAEDEVYAWLNARGQDRTDLVKYLVNSNTDNMYSRISKDFYVERNKARKEGNVEFFTSNYEIYDLPKYKKWFADKITEQKRALGLRYAYLKDMDLSKFNQAVLKGINSWVDDNDLSLDSAGLPAHPNAWLRENWWLRQTEASKEKNETTEYKFIKSHKPLFNYYNTIAELNKEFRDILELEYGRLPENFLPNIRADVLEKALTGNFKNVLTDMREMFQIRQDETMFGQMNNAGEYEKKVPIYFINPFVDEDGNIKRGEKSYDFGRSMILFAKMAYNNKYMREIEADVLALKEVMMKEAQFKKMNVFGKQTFDFMGNPATTAGADVKSMEMFNSFIDYYIYGIKIKEQGISKNIGGITINSTKALLEAKRYFSLKALGLGFIPAGASFVAATTQAYVEGSKGLIYTTKNWNDATRHMGADYKKYSALGYLFGVHSGEVTEYAKVTKDNNVFGIGDPLERDTIRKYVNARVLMRPFSYGDERIDNHIANAMALNYGIDDTGRIRRLINLPEGAKSLWERVQYKDDTLVIEGIEDPAIMRKAVIGFRNAVRAAQQKIKGSMSTEDINYAQTNLVLNLMMQFKTWMPGVLQERFGELRYNKYLDAPEWGRYRAYFTDFSPEKDKDIGAWLFNTVAKKAMQTAVDVATFGLVKTYKVDEVKSKLEFEKWRLENPDLGKGLDVKMYIEIKQKQINATIAELRILLIIAAVLSMLGADWDDDGINNYREFWITHKLYQILSRTATEIGFASPLNPSSGRELQRLVANPLPLAGLLSDVGKIAQNTYDEFLDLLFGEDVKMFGKTGKGDKTDNFYYTITLLPGGYQLRRFLDLYEQDQKALR